MGVSLHPVTQHIRNLLLIKKKPTVLFQSAHFFVFPSLRKKTNFVVTINPFHFRNKTVSLRGITISSEFMLFHLRPGF